MNKFCRNCNIEICAIFAYLCISFNSYAERFFVRNIDIRGNNVICRETIIRYLNLSTNSLVQSQTIFASTNQLLESRLFKSVSCKITNLYTNVIDVTYEVEEKRNRYFYVGFGLSAIEGPVVFTDFSIRNISLNKYPPIGDDKILRLFTQWGFEGYHVRLSLFDPYLANLSQNAEYAMFKDDKRYLGDVYNESDMGIQLRLSKALEKQYIRLSIQYEFKQVELYGMADNVSEDIREWNGFTSQGVITPSISYDSRDKTFMTTYGDWCKLSPSFSSEFLGGNVNIYGVTWRSSSFCPIWFNHVIHLSTGIDTVESYNNDDSIPLFDRTYLGGFGTVRGYKYRDIGGHDNQGNSLGGRTATFGSVEYIVPFTKLAQIVVFYDTGYNSGQSFDFSPSQVYDSCGFGARAKIGPFPVICDYAIPLRDTDTHHPRIEIQVGYVF
ncbi:MAG: BamA/TamA family outer membrane protein [Methanomassiliicoccales archaeon]|jgi:outer membrane protein insertion porin family